ncbi:MAG TPA: aminoacyl-tRNA hydrolase [Planctomycetales bacterium]|jgi:PTH1 family peptidyl-tRNA hydrolase|nr:aminoacyl-tRNA hydrolase [Planctomycetales bacterium]
MKVVVGLGNPGARYQRTRHNVGFDVVDSLAASPHAGRFQSRFQAQVAEVLEDGEKLFLVKPETFMNLSGRSVRQVMDFFQVEATDLLVVCDDISLPLGKLRIRAKGTHGGHNGLRDIQNHLGGVEYARLRIGVDAPRDDAIDHVLGRFRPAERAAIDDAVALAAQAVVFWARQGVEAVMNKYNAEAKDKGGKNLN